ncbi:SDR family oxidoreductase [Gallaecimonas mangrovi]|uniref:SDR family oxidoreductase n=1 Tax=Gallaecimonas mangrovi TaxID=2291597 RepID=UPI000E1FF96C|nr:SDR family oxidoreductase [Gallaecimonas mangrovi]
MQIFLTGANGWIGSAIVRELLDAGHSVTGLARSKEKAEVVRAMGATPIIGDITDLDVLRKGASDAEAVIHTAFGLEIAEIERLAKEDSDAINAFGEVFAGSTRPILVTDGYLHMTGKYFTEQERPEIATYFPRASAQTAFALADKGVYASVVRNPRSVHGQGETHGFVPMLAAVAREKGVSAYVDDGQHLWPAVHRLDCARVYRLAIERGARGEAYHAVGDEGVPFKDIAEAVGRQVGVPAKSLTLEEAQAHFGPIAPFIANSGPVSTTWTRETLRWAPEHPGIIEDIGRPDYAV